jgi:soluble lytic murein transglycosylase
MNDQDADRPGAVSRPDRATRRTWLIFPIGASALLLSAQAWNATPVAQQALAPAPERVSGLTNTAAGRLAPTNHPDIPTTRETMWFAPAEKTLPEESELARFARGVRLLDESGDAAAALPLLNIAGIAKTDVAEYGRYYTGLALQRLGRYDEAEAAFVSIPDKGDSNLPEFALYRRAELREARGDFQGAVALYDQLLTRKLASPQVALVKLGAAASAAGDRARAIDVQRRVLREFTLSPEAVEAEQLLDRIDGFVFDSPAAIAEELGRAETLFKARRWDQAKSAFERVRDAASSAEKDRITLRLAQILAAKGQHHAAREVFRRFVAHETLAREAQFGLVVAARVLGDKSDYRQLTADFVARYPNDPLAEEALADLAREYILDDEDEKAAQIYSQMVERFPAGAFAERAIWKAGWWAYREKNFAEAVRLFEHGAATFPRSDYRPSWLYWSARAYDQLGNAPQATDRFRLTATDYLNSYYGRLAWKQLEQRKEATVTPGVRRTVAPPDPPPNVKRIARLMELGLYRPAVNEIQYAQKVWGDSAPLQATLALAQNKLGNLRLAINAMKRAYPQYIAAGGEEMPAEILRILYPVDYFPLLKGNAQARGLDPYLVAALVLQESNFDAGIRSSAKAVGLMQVLPSTGRRYAKKMNIRTFSERSLTNPEINVTIGTQYFNDLVGRFGAPYFALASYNAGESRVQRWLNETPGLPEDEFIDNIPFPETQNYVKRILGTAEDFRRLYGEQATVPAIKRTTTVKKSTASAPAKRTGAKRVPAKSAPAHKPAAKKKPAKH